MRTKRHDKMPCSVEGCERLSWARGWCRKHYARWRSHGDPRIVLVQMATAGDPAAFLAEALKHETDDCLLWPYASNGVGYGQINIKGKKYLVHRLVCENAHGAAPKDKPLSVHSCGNGHQGCISPRHLRWASAKENSMDMIQHGRSGKGRSMAQTPLSQRQVLEIHKRANAGESQKKIATEFGIGQTAVSHIKKGRNWGWLTQGAVK